MFVFCFVLIFCHEDQGNQTQNTLLLCTAQTNFPEETTTIFSSLVSHFR